MKKEVWKGGNMLYPVPAVMVSCADQTGRSNILTIAWAGTVCTNPPMVSISVRPERWSYDILKKSGEFVINLPTERLARQTDEAGVRSGRDCDKWKLLGLTPEKGAKVSAPLIAECPGSWSSPGPGSSSTPTGSTIPSVSFSGPSDTQSERKSAGDCRFACGMVPAFFFSLADGAICAINALTMSALPEKAKTYQQLSGSLRGTSGVFYGIVSV